MGCSGTRQRWELYSMQHPGWTQGPHLSFNMKPPGDSGVLGAAGDPLQPDQLC